MTFREKFPTPEIFENQIMNTLFGKTYDAPPECCEQILSNERTHVQKHICKTDVQTMESILDKQNRTLCGDGSFVSHHDTWDAIREALLYRSNVIYGWLEDMPLEDYTKSKSISAPVSTESGETLGSGFVKTIDGKIHSYMTDSITVVIMPDPNSPLKFAVKTAYPGTNAKDNLYNDMTLSTDKVKSTIQQTEHYKNAGRVERAYLDYVSEPEKHTYGATYIPSSKGGLGCVRIIVPSQPSEDGPMMMDQFTLYKNFIKISRTTTPTTFVNRYNDEVYIRECEPKTHPLVRQMPQHIADDKRSISMDYETFESELGKIPAYKNVVNDVMCMRALIQHQDPTPFERRKTNDRLTQIDTICPGAHTPDEKNTYKSFDE